ncbi:MAG: hypothetical protein GYA87_09385, partial [Christensenellaceae bacterium]|nr:hypothetical protein [Christensenellaceae bacterium]
MKNTEVIKLGHTDGGEKCFILNVKTLTTVEIKNHRCELNALFEVENKNQLINQ